MITYIQVFTCDYCGATKTKRTDGVIPYEMINREVCPLRWTWVGEKLACPDHTIVVKDKGEKAE